MTIGGWILMIFSVSAVVCLFGWCITKVLMLDPVEEVEHLHGELDIEVKEKD